MTSYREKDIATSYNTTILILRGWINYFGKYNASAIKYTLDCVERRIVKWAM
ncbi:group II intron maturase-specific domain-containing protein [Anaerovirgula multivorans]|uniref:group II intron maturase-specific domain-containing protein n=1 Tax=Anaerovirgula multivorans TaxID=312168 RepID=UPI001FA8DE19